MRSEFRADYLLHFRKPVIQRVAGAAHGADRILLAARVEQFAQPPDMHIHGAFVDIDIAAPDAVEQLLAAEHPARVLQKKLQQPVFGRSRSHRTAPAPDTALPAIHAPPFRHRSLRRRGCSVTAWSALPRLPPPECARSYA